MIEWIRLRLCNFDEFGVAMANYRIRILPIILVLIIGLVNSIQVVANFNEQIDMTNNQEREWPLSHEFGFPIWIPLNASPSDKGLNIRRIFLLIEASNFTKDNLQRAFLGLAAQNKWPDDLIITAFSDKKMLLRAIDNYQSPICIYFNKSPQNQEAIQKFYEQYYPLNSGYFRAFYFRHQNGDESFQYSPESDKEELVRVPLKKRPN